MENFLASRPSIAKLGVQPRKTANLFAAMANRTSARSAAPPSSDTGNVQAPADPGAHGHEVQVDLVRENGAVQRIVVVCKCGERIELDCVY